MARSDWRDRILESTRGRVLSLLRRSERTVGDPTWRRSWS